MNQEGFFFVCRDCWRRRTSGDKTTQGGLIMALTLEAALVVPLTMALTIGMLYSSICLYERTAADARIESTSLYYSVHNEKSWSCTVQKDFKCQTWSKMISVNPVRIKNILSAVYDTIGGIKEIIPAFREMEALYFEDAT